MLRLSKLAIGMQLTPLSPQNFINNRPRLKTANFSYLVCFQFLQTLMIKIGVHCRAHMTRLCDSNVLPWLLNQNLNRIAPLKNETKQFDPNAARLFNEEALIWFEQA